MVITQNLKRQEQKRCDQHHDTEVSRGDEKRSLLSRMRHSKKSYLAAHLTATSHSGYTALSAEGNIRQMTVMVFAF